MLPLLLPLFTVGLEAQSPPPVGERSSSDAPQVESSEDRSAAPAQELRLAWIAHRIEGDLDRAERGYSAVVAHPAAETDVQARALLGLAILKRDRGDVAGASRHLDRCFDLEGMAPRWRDSARILRAELEGTAIPTVGAPPDLLRELQDRVQSLQGDVERWKRAVDERESELATKNQLLLRLEELEREAEVSAASRDRVRELRRSREQQYLEELVEDDRQSQQLSRYFIRSHLLRGREAFEAGRFLEAHNEIKSVLALDPHHREALELSAQCRALLAESAGRGEFGPPDPQLWRATPRRLVVELSTSFMTAHLEEAERHLEGGRILDAMNSASKVLEEYAWCPAPLPDEVVSTIVGGAERVLEKCMGTSGEEDTARVRDLFEQQLVLIQGLKRDFTKWMATERALAETDESALRMAEGLRGGEDSPSVGPRPLAREFESSMSRAEHAIAARRPLEAVGHYRDMLILLEWDQGLDPEGTIAEQLEAQLRALGSKIPDSSPPKPSPAERGDEVPAPSP